jgi:hypothetical protein
MHPLILLPFLMVNDITFIFDGETTIGAAARSDGEPCRCRRYRRCRHRPWRGWTVGRVVVGQRWDDGSKKTWIDMGFSSMGVTPEPSVSILK